MVEFDIENEIYKATESLKKIIKSCQFNKAKEFINPFKTPIKTPIKNTSEAINERLQKLLNEGRILFDAKINTPINEIYDLFKDITKATKDIHPILSRQGIVTRRGGSNCNPRITRAIGVKINKELTND